MRRVAAHVFTVYVNYGYAINLICQFCVFSYFVDLKNLFRTVYMYVVRERYGNG